MKKILAVLLLFSCLITQAQQPTSLLSNQNVPTTHNGTIFTFSSLNSTTTQLAATATFTGTIESVVSSQAYSILVYSDQPGTVTIKQYIDAAGTKLISTTSYVNTASVGLNRSGILNGNYVQVTYQNTGGSTTTALNVDMAYGTIQPVNQLGNLPISISDLNGTAIAGTGLPVTETSATASANGNITTQNLNPLTGTPTAGSFVRLTLNNQSTATITVSGTYTGALSLQYSTDGGTTWVTYTNTNQLVFETSGSTSATIASASVGAWTTDISGLTDIRVSALAAVTGTAVVNIRAVQAAQQIGINQSLPAGTANIGAISIGQIGSATGSFATDATNAAKALGVAQIAPFTFADKASGAVTTTGNSGTITSGFGNTISGLINITAVSGTTPTMDIALQESYDNGTTWQDIYHTPRFTATTTFPVPNMLIGGRRRWIYTISGTTPSFTFSINIMQGNVTAPIFRSFYDRTLSSTQALNATTNSYNIEGCKQITMIISSGAATTPCAIKMQYSMDGTNFYDASTILTSVASSSVAVTSTTNLQVKYVRGIVTTAGSGQALTHINFFGTN